MNILGPLVRRNKDYKQVYGWYQHLEDRLAIQYAEMREFKLATEERERHLLQEIKRLEEDNIRLTNLTYEQQQLIEKDVDKQVRSIFTDIEVLANRANRLAKNLFGYYGKCMACGHIGKEVPTSFGEEIAEKMIYLEMRPCPKCGSERIVIK